MDHRPHLASTNGHHSGARPGPVNTIGVVVGSTRPGSIASSIARWFVDSVDSVDGDARHFTFEIVDLSGPPVPPQDIERIAGVVIVTPEYNHSVPGELKSFIDAYRGEWGHKPVTFVSYGGISAGLRAVDALRLVFAELYAVPTRNVVALTDPHLKTSADGHLTLGDGAVAAANLALTELTWWIELLRTRGRAAYLPPLGVAAGRVAN